MKSASPDSKLENGEAGQSTMDTIEIPKVPLQAPTTIPPDTSSSKTGLPPSKDSPGKKLDSRTASKTFKIPKFSRLDSFIKNRPKEFKSKVFVVFLFAVIIVGVPLIWSYYTATTKALEAARKIRFDETTRIWRIFNQKGDTVLQGKLGRGMPQRMIPSKCKVDIGNDEICYRWLKRATLTVQYEIFDDVICYDVNWHTPEVDMVFTDNFFFDDGDANWYGGGEYNVQNWPIEVNIFNDVWFTTGNLDNDGQQMGAFLESYWLSSKGVALMITSEGILKMKLDPSNNHTIGISSTVATKHGQDPDFNYTICVANNITRIHQFMVDKYFIASKDAPKDILFEKPIWSTFGRYRDNFSQQEVYKFVEEISQNNFEGSYFLFEKGWQSFIGNFEFNSLQFDNTTSMVSMLIASGLEPAVVLYPQLDVRSEHFKHCVLNDFCVRDSGNSTAGLSKWKDGVAAVVDPSDSKAVKWYVTLVKNFKEKYNISTVVFEGGLVNSLPYQSITHDYSYESNHLTTAFIEMISKAGKLLAIGSSWRTQHLPLVLSISSRISNWSYKRGLKSVISTVLNLGLLGYPYILPGVVGGNVILTDWKDGIRKPDRELYIRWVQLASLMPFMKFSVPPWDYDEEVVNITRSFLEFRKHVIVPKLKSALFEAKELGYPLIRPLWWIAPSDEIAQTINNQFLIGNNTMVAPIISKHKDSRDIYLPAGKWYDNLRKVQYLGNAWLKNYTTSYYEVAYFSYLSV